MAEKKLYKSNNKMIAGVCAGLAEYFNVDPTLVRVIWAAGLLIGGVALLVYIICAIVMPKKD